MSTENSKAAVIKAAVILAAVILAAVILARCAILKPATALFKIMASIAEFAEYLP